MTSIARNIQRSNSVPCVILQGNIAYFTLFGVHLEFFMERVVPEVFCVVPVSDDAIVQWIGALQERPQL